MMGERFFVAYPAGERFAHGVGRGAYLPLCFSVRLHARLGHLSCEPVEFGVILVSRHLVQLVYAPSASSWALAYPVAPRL